MKQILWIVLICAAGCTAVPIDKKEGPSPAGNCTVIIKLDSTDLRDELIEQLTREFSNVPGELDISRYGWSSNESEDRRMPVRIWGPADLVDQASRRAVELIGNNAYKIAAFPQNIYELRLPDIVFYTPKLQYRRNLALTMAGEKVLLALEQQGLITCTCSGRPASVVREKEREFVFQSCSVACKIYDAAVLSVKRDSSGFIAKQDAHVYCAGTDRFVDSVTQMISGVGVKFEYRDYAFTALRLFRFYGKLQPEAQELCKYIFCWSRKLNSRTIEEASCLGPPFPAIRNSSELDSFIITLARYVVDTERVESTGDNEECEGMVILPAPWVTHAVRILVLAKDKDSISLLFSKILLANGTDGIMYVNAIAEIMGEEAIWHLVAISENTTASNETRWQAFTCLKKIDTPDARLAVGRLRLAIEQLPIGNDANDEHK